MVPRYAGFVTTLRTGWLPGGSRFVARGRPVVATSVRPSFGDWMPSGKIDSIVEDARQELARCASVRRGRGQRPREPGARPVLVERRCASDRIIPVC
jgi:hypothetical protein